MEVKLNRLNKAFHFEATNEEGLKIQIDGSPEIGGEGNGVRPMELLLMAIGGCSSIDIGLILKKQRQELVEYNMVVNAERHSNIAKTFRSIHLHYNLWGNLDEEKVIIAIELAVSKYCSVLLSLDKAIVIDYSYKIHSNV